jgi:hypothetical protein
MVGHCGRQTMDTYPLDQPSVNARAACSGVQSWAWIMEVTMSATTSLEDLTWPSAAMVKVAIVLPSAPVTVNSGRSVWPAMDEVPSRGSRWREGAR